MFFDAFREYIISMISLMIIGTRGVSIMSCDGYISEKTE